MISNVSVSKPNWHENKYSLVLGAASSTKGIILVASPIAIGNTPDAIGSNVPICPNFLVPIIRATLPPAVLENRPESLSKITQPDFILLYHYPNKFNCGVAGSSDETTFFLRGADFCGGTDI